MKSEFKISLILNFRTLRAFTSTVLMVLLLLFIKTEKRQNQNICEGLLYMVKIQPKRILVVEDDPLMMTLLKKAILDVLPDSEIFWATSLEQAFGKIVQNSTIYEKKPYELIVADVFLKGSGTGLDLWRVLCATYPQIPFLVISSLSEENIVTAVGEAEKKNLFFFRKPFSFIECKNKIKNILAGKLTTDEKISSINALTNFPLLNYADKHQQMANLIILRLSTNWLERQQWLNEPYGGQNPVQDFLFQVKHVANRLWDLCFSKKKNKPTVSQDNIKEFVLKISELTPELKAFVVERSEAMGVVFNNIYPNRQSN